MNRSDSHKQVQTSGMVHSRKREQDEAYGSGQSQHDGFYGRGEDDVQVKNNSHVEKGLGSSGAAMKRSPTEASDAVSRRTSGHVSGEDDHPTSSPANKVSAAMERAPSGTKRAESRYQSEAMDQQKRGERVSMDAKHKAVDADHAIGSGAPVGGMSAEGFTEETTSRAQRKEDGEPEREADEMAAMGNRGKSRMPSTKNVMGHGERATIAKHTI